MNTLQDDLDISCNKIIAINKLGASKVQRKRLIVNTNNRSERAEQKMTVQSSFCKNAKQVPKLKIGKTCEAVRAGLIFFYDIE
jgi:hypothetical protein